MTTFEWVAIAFFVALLPLAHPNIAASAKRRLAPRSRRSERISYLAGWALLAAWVVAVIVFDLPAALLVGVVVGALFLALLRR